MGNLHYMGAGSGGSTPLNGIPNDSPADTPDHAVADGYGSEDFVAGSSSSRERKKGLIIFIAFSSRPPLGRESFSCSSFRGAWI